jgi:hypothetical protein
MKLLSLLTLVSSLFAVSAFQPNPTKKSAAIKPAFRKDTAVQSPLFRDPLQVRGGAVPGWATYNDALDKTPLTAKALTSLVGWALGDFLAQVRFSTVTQQILEGCHSR